MTDLPVLLEVAVVVLLAVTLLYCIVLERRMAAFNRGRDALGALVAELDGATARAERAVVGLSQTARQSEDELDRRIAEARALTNKLTLMAGAARPRSHIRAGAAQTAHGTPR